MVHVNVDAPADEILVVEPGAVVVADRETEAFWAAAHAGRFVIQRCRSCGARSFPPVGMCRRCHALDLDWTEAPTEWTVQSWIVVHHPIFPHLAGEIPYTVVLAELDDGARILARWIDDDPPSAGGAVRLAIGDVGGSMVPVASAR
jgi:hypothetical protein